MVSRYGVIYRKSGRGRRKQQRFVCQFFGFLVQVVNGAVVFLEDLWYSGSREWRYEFFQGGRSCLVQFLIVNTKTGEIFILAYNR